MFVNVFVSAFTITYIRQHLLKCTHERETYMHHIETNTCITFCRHLLTLLLRSNSVPHIEKHMYRKKEEPKNTQYIMNEIILLFFLSARINRDIFT